MNKKFFLGMFAAAGMLLATSCSNDELIEQGSGDTATVSFSLTTEGAPMTRAISDGKSANALWYAVFDAQGKRIESIEAIEGKEVAFPATENLRLAKGQTYKVAFWAQNKDCGAYEVDDDMNVTVKYENATNNDETRDAFFKTVEFTVNGDASIDVELKRPFAQINVGVTQEDWENAVASGIEIAKSLVKIKNAATSLDLLTGKVEEATEVTYMADVIPDENLMVDYNNDGTKESYKWLSMCYILVDDESETPTTDGVYGASKTTLDKLAFEFQTADGKSIKFEEGLNGVPVQRNYRTNIVGRILTGSIDFNISIDDEFEDDHNYPDGSIGQQLEFAAKVGGTVTLTENVTLTKTLEVAKGVSMVIDLNGHSIINESSTGDFGTDEAIIVYGNLTIEGEGAVESNSMAVWARGSGNNAVVNIKGGTYKGLSTDLATGGRGVIYASGGNTINIYGGTFEAKAADKTSFSDKTNGVYAALNVADNNGAINVYGGSFYKFNPKEPGTEPATWSADHSNGFVAEGYKSIQVGELCYVVPDDVDTVATTYDELVDALNNEKDIALFKDITLTSPVTVKENVTILGNGHAITGYTVTVQNNVTIKDAVLENPINNHSNASNLYCVNLNGKLTLDGCTFRGTQWDGLQIAGDIKDGSEVVINNCIFEFPKKTAKRYIHIEKNDGSACITKLTVKLTNNTFRAAQLGNDAIGIYGIDKDYIDYGGNNVIETGLAAGERCDILYVGWSTNIWANNQNDALKALTGN